MRSFGGRNSSKHADPGCLGATRVAAQPRNSLKLMQEG